MCIVSGDPQNGDLRLVDSSGGFIGNSGGRVEIYLNGNWGVIQQYLQSDQTSDWAAAANTICRQQGYDHANGYGPVAKYESVNVQVVKEHCKVTIKFYHVFRCHVQQQNTVYFQIS